MASTADSDSVRRLLYGGSTKTGTLSTADVDWFVDDQPNIWFAASMAAQAEAQNLSRTGTKSVGDLSIDYGMSVGNMMALSKKYEAEGIRGVKPHAGGISIAAKAANENDADWSKTAGSIGVHDWNRSESTAPGVVSW